jgi:hypothetical protein
MIDNQNKIGTLNPAQATELFRILGMIEKTAGTWMCQIKDSKISQWVGSFMFVELDLKELLIEQDKELPPQSTDGQKKKTLYFPGMDLSFLVEKNRVKHLKSLLGSKDIEIGFDEDTQTYIFNNKYSSYQIDHADSNAFTEPPCQNATSVGGEVKLETLYIQHINKYLKSNRSKTGHLLIYEGQLEGYQAFGGAPVFFTPGYENELMKKTEEMNLQISQFLAMAGKDEIKLKLFETENGKDHWLFTESKTSKGITLRLTQELF